jgi:hypothetical protein
MVRVHPDPPVFCDNRRHSALSERLPTDVGVALLRLDWLDSHKPLLEWQPTCVAAEVTNVLVALGIL